MSLIKLTLPRSSNLVIMIILNDLCSHTIRQKSPNVSGKGPWKTRDIQRWRNVLASDYVAVSTQIRLYNVTNSSKEKSSKAGVFHWKSGARCVFFSTNQSDIKYGMKIVKDRTFHAVSGI